MTINAYVVVNMTLFTKENNVQNILRQDKCYGARYLLKEFHFRQWSGLSLDWPTAVSKKAK